MASAQKILRPERPPLSASALFITQTQTVNFPAWAKRAKVTIVDGGYSSATATGGIPNTGKGGDSSISWIDLVPSVPYVVTVGAGGVGPIGPSNSPSVAGGFSSIQGRNQAALTSANGLIRVPGGNPVTNGNGAQSGASILGMGAYNTPGGYGSGGYSPSANANGINGIQGCVLIELL